MFLSSKLVEVYISDMDRVNPKYLDNFFSSNMEEKPKYGIYGSQLVKEYKVPKALGTKMSALLNAWYVDLKNLEGVLTEDLLTRLTNCTDVFNITKRSAWRCKKKICPWCRGVMTLSMEDAVATSGAYYCTITDFGVSDTLPRVPKAPGACMSLKNVVFQPGRGLILRVMRFYTSEKKGSLPISKDRVRELLGYDYTIITDNRLLLDWMELTKGMNLFTRERAVKS